MWMMGSLCSRMRRCGFRYVLSSPFFHRPLPFSVSFRSILTLQKLEASSGMLSAVPQGSYKDANALANVTIMGVSSRPRSVSFNRAKLGGGWSYDSSSKILAVTQLNSATSSGAWAAPWSLSWA